MIKQEAKTSCFYIPINIKNITPKIKLNIFTTIPYKAIKNLFLSFNNIKYKQGSIMNIPSSTKNKIIKAYSSP